MIDENKRPLTDPTAGAETFEDAAPLDTALCLSGGGYRAMLFHLGTLIRLNEAGLLPKIAMYSSVSGGSITNGVLGLAWHKLNFDGAGVASNLMPLVVDKVRTLADVTVDEESIVEGLLWFGTVSDHVAADYDKYLFHGATLQQLPDTPRFVFNATNVQTRSLFRFSKPYIADYRIGLWRNPNVAIAKAVTASSAVHSESRGNGLGSRRARGSLPETVPHETGADRWGRVRQSGVGVAMEAVQDDLRERCRWGDAGGEGSG
jgi:NTE family protein